MRKQTHTPIAMGELFNNPREFTPLIANKLIDFIRCHVSQIGGITPAKKLANFCEAFSVRTAWHGPGDTSPVGHAADIHLDVSSWNFGIQEWAGFKQASLDVFPGCPELKKGYVYPNDKPAWASTSTRSSQRSSPAPRSCPPGPTAAAPTAPSIAPKTSRAAARHSLAGRLF